MKAKANLLASKHQGVFTVNNQGLRYARSSLINQARLAFEQEPLDHHQIRNPAEPGESRIELLKWDT